MKTTLKKLFGIIPMSAEEREAVAMLPVVCIVFFAMVFFAVVFG